MRFGKYLTIAAMAAALSITSACPAWAIDASAIKEDTTCTWTYDRVHDIWRVTDSNNDPVSGWAKHGGKLYFLTGIGIARTGWLKYNGDWYYLYDDEDDISADPRDYVGTMATDTWIDNYYVNAEGIKSDRSRNFFR